MNMTMAVLQTLEPAISPELSAIAYISGQRFGPWLVEGPVVQQSAS